MNFTREQKQEAYRKLSPEVQSFIMDNETTELIAKFLNEAGLSEEQSVSADSEIFYALLGLQTFSNTLSNIAKLSNKNINDLAKLKANLDNNIFFKVKRSGLNPILERKDNVGLSFEQAIVNQAKAMRPVGVVPSNLPTGINEKPNNPYTIPGKENTNFPSDPLTTPAGQGYPGSDPYREAAN